MTAKHLVMALLLLLTACAGPTSGPFRKVAALFTTEAIPQAGALPTTKAIPQAGAAVTTEAIPQAGVLPTTKAIPQVGAVATTEATTQAGPAATTEAIPKAGVAATTEAIPKAAVAATTEAIPQAGPAATTEAIPQADVAAISEVFPTPGAAATSEPVPTAGVAATSAATSRAGAAATTRAIPKAAAAPVSGVILKASAAPTAEAIPKAAAAPVSGVILKASAAPTAEAVLRAADQARGNVTGLAWEVTIQTAERENVTDTLVYDIKVRSFNVAGTSLAPPKYRGNKILMLNTSMWFYKPGLSKPVPISQRQKLMGDASYGDIASTNYADHYSAERLPDQVFNGEECYVFDLKAKAEKVTYDRITYWVSKQRQLGVKAEYFTVSGKKFKSAWMDYANSVKLDGKPHPFLSRITMKGELLNGAVTYLHLRSPHIEPIPDYVFDLNLFMR